MTRPEPAATVAGDDDGLCDADGHPVRDGAPIAHVDLPALRGRIEQQVTPTRVRVTWHAGEQLPTAQSVTIPAEYVVQTEGNPT